MRRPLAASAAAGALLIITLCFFIIRMVLAAPVPQVSFVGVDSTPLVGESTSFTVRFNNVGTNVGYGPYVDLVLPQYLTLSSVTYAGTPITPEGNITMPQSNPSCVTHPFARDNTGQLKQACLNANPGPSAKLYSMKLPFGSFTQNQTVADIQVTITVAGGAPVGSPLDVWAQGGFYLGQDPLDDPTSDPSIESGFTSTPVTPEVVKIRKTYISDYLTNGSDIASGPNHEQAFRITADVANGATIDNLTLSDVLPSPLIRDTEVNVTTGGTDNSSGNTASVAWGSITGGASSSDATLDVKFYVPYRDGSNNLVLSGTNSYQQTVQNSATISGTYNSQPLSVSPAGPVNLPIKALIDRKKVTDLTDTDPSPGDTLEYKIDTYVSDYEAVKNLNLADMLPDGESFVSDGSATYTVTQNGSTSSATAITPSSNAQPNGETNLGFDLSAVGNLLGGCVPDGGTGGSDPDCALHDDGRTSVEVTFHATISNTYHDSSAVEDGDVLTNSVTSNSDLLSNVDLSNAGTNVNDNSSASVTITKGSLSKSIYAVNGSTTVPSRLKPGDVVTYRLQYSVPGTDFGDLKLDDYLPLPMFDNGGMSTTFNTTIDASAPATNTAKFGPGETLHSYSSLTPTVSTQAGNVVEFTWPATQDPSNTNRQIDVLFSVTIQDKAYAPGLFVTNQATLSEGDTDGTFSSTSTNQIDLQIPEPTITKGVVATDNPAGNFTPSIVGPVPFSAPSSSGTRFTGTIDSSNLATSPIKSDLKDVDAGDKLTYAVVMENKGTGNLYNAVFKDVLPASNHLGSAISNVTVTDGTGAALGYTDLGGGLLGSGIQLNNAVDNVDTTTPGANVVVITFDVTIQAAAEAGETLTNEGDLTHFAAEDGGVNYMNNQAAYSDTANVTIADASMSKNITNTNLADVASPKVVVGEQVTYTTTLTVPEGTMTGATMVDTLNACLAVSYLDSLTASSGVTASAGSMSSVLSAATISNVGGGTANDGRRISLSFGDIVNSNTSNNPATITLVYRVVPVNSSACARGDQRKNDVVTTWNTSSTASASAPNVVIQEPSVTINKAFTPNTGDADDVVHIQLSIAAQNATNDSPAYNVAATDNLNSTNFTYVGNMQTISGPAPTTSNQTSGVVTYTWDKLDLGQTSVVQFDVKVKEGVSQGSTNNNTADVTYTSFPGTPDSNQDQHNALACERTGNTSDCGGSENDYTNSSTTGFTVPSIDQMTKSLVTTSESSTTGSNVAIGEIARFRMTARVPEGTDPTTLFKDNLPTGLQFLNDGTAKAALVSNGNMSSSTMSGSGLNVTGDQTTLSAITPTFVIPGTAINGAPFTTGREADFNFGTVANTDNDANDEFIVVEFNALINNDSSITRGTQLNNQLTVSQGGNTVGSSPATTLTVQEPNDTVTKTVTTAPVDAGDPVAYNITITNTGGSNVTTGFDWNFNDTLDQYLDYQSVTNLTAPGYATATPSATLGTNDKVTVIIDQLRAGDSVTFTINAVVKGNAPAHYIVPNTDDATTTSLPGPKGTTSNPTGSSTPGNTGDPDGERQSDGSGSANTQLGAPSIDKQNPQEGTSAGVGATLTYPIVVHVPQGVTQNVTVTDNLPVGLQYISHTIDTTGFSGSFANSPPIRTSPASSPGGSGVSLGLNFGNVTVPGDTGSYATFKILVVVRVTNETFNQVGHQLANTASLTYTDPNTNNPSTVNSGTVTVTVAEPELQLTKTIGGTDPRHVGDTLTYTVTVQNIGNATAYEWQINDLMASPTTLSGTPSCTKDGNPIATSHTVTNVGASNELTINESPNAGSTLAVNKQIVCTYNVKITNSAVIDSTYTNTAETFWWSGPSSSPQSRHYDDSYPYTVDGSQDTDDAQFTMAGADFNKSDGGITGAVVGQIITYTLVAQMPAGTVDNFVVGDTLPTGMVYVDTPSITGTSVTPIFVVSSPNDGSAPVNLSWNFGTLTDATPKRIIVTYRARVANTSVNVNGHVVTNNAQMDYQPQGDPFPTNLQSQDSFTVDEPKLDITKTADKTGANYGTIVNYTIAVSHDALSTADAFNLHMSDVVPSGMTLVAGSVQSADPSWNIVEAGNGFTATKPTYILGSAATTITYQARVNAPPSAPTVGSGLNNTADITWTSLSGSNTNGRDGSGGVNDYDTSDPYTVTADAIDMAITKSDPSGPYIPGDTIPYNLQVQNLGNVTATGITVTETVPTDTTFNAGASTSGWSCANGSQAGTQCTFLIASMNAAGSTNITFAVKINDDDHLPANITQISNTAAVAADPTNGSEVTMSNNTSGITSPLQIADLQIVKDDTRDPVYITHDFDYTLTVTNNGPDTATNVHVHDTMPAGVSITGTVIANNVGMVCGVSGADFDCDMSSMPNGTVVIITVPVNGDTPGKKVNTATVAGDQHDPDHDNNSDSETTLVDPADIVLTKTVDNAHPSVGQTVTFTVGVTNKGPDDATNLTITDTMPSMFQVLSLTPGQGTCNNTSPIVCHLGNLANGAHTNIVIKAKVLKTGTSTNLVSSTINEYDPNPNNNTNIGVTVTAIAALTDTGLPLIGILAASSLLIGTALHIYLRKRQAPTTPSENTNQRQ